MRAMALLLLMALSGCSNLAEAPPSVPEPPRFALVSSDPVAHGERLSKVLGCSGCHDDPLTGRDWSDPDYGSLWAANLTRSAARWSEGELTQMIVAGRRPDRALMEMPSHLFMGLHPADVSSLVAYLKSLKAVGPIYPEPNIGPMLAEEIAAGAYRNSAQQVADYAGKGPPDLGPEHALGRQILSATCAECHGGDLRGKPAPASDAAARPDLRIVASYLPEDFATLLRTGKAAGNREVGLMSTVARRRYANLTDAEVAAIRTYLTELAARDP